MKKRFLFSTLAVLFSLSCSVFTSCSDDDDDSAKVEFSINNSTVENNGNYLLAKSTSDPKSSAEDEIITLNITSDKEISNVQITMNNNWANNVDVVDVNGKAYNGKSNEAAASTSKKIEFVGVLGTYTVKVNGQTYKFTLQNSKNESDYKGNSRYLSNKQTVIYDATGKEYASKIFNMTYVYDKANNNKFLNGKLSAISEEAYNSASSDYSKSELGEMGEKQESYSTKYNLNETPSYFIYQSGDNFYLVKVVSIKENILTAEVQY
ncbi:MAG: hypothetical protein MJZ33_10185 [Paludibacteraceae bacterium]|nr:hypothetical protein [Paludibacteraceae bacterium]